ncbi:Transmembrane protein [Quillaja saponaria]|uniref:Transmembrane protein n=1 Tax=Quillaja saponaria TaxID=32244 RepID=A0AAD7PJ56_QUISA|nr:Transmembrane protein [Quillaja saponaria]
MQRLSSTTRASEEFINMSGSAMASPSLRASTSADHLPLYNPIPDSTKKEAPIYHKSSGENAIHLIPIVLILCGLILWIFSHPADTRLLDEILLLAPFILPFCM